MKLTSKLWDLKKYVLMMQDQRVVRPSVRGLSVERRWPSLRWCCSAAGSGGKRSCSIPTSSTTRTTSTTIISTSSAKNRRFPTSTQPNMTSVVTWDIRRRCCRRWRHWHLLELRHLGVSSHDVTEARAPTARAVRRSKSVNRTKQSGITHFAHRTWERWLPTARATQPATRHARLAILLPLMTSPTNRK